ncbi:uncharacterized protein LOC133822933 [Humulus lupulus]|uniref:uncharacterized protein LOC133822933 n=1 Tax=Humulus lupulus TaxID=3486 RepID=UPI002B412A69|nr:uncharacterized protein LOC133822933 [Humulus lupulus]
MLFSDINSYRILIRPHPANWRLVHGMAVVYLVALTFLLFQKQDDARQFMKFLHPDLGVELPERSYGADCRIYLPENPTSRFKNVCETLFDEFVLAHIIGWWGKAILLRNQPLLWVLSIGFEMMEPQFIASAGNRSFSSNAPLIENSDDQIVVPDVGDRIGKEHCKVNLQELLNPDKKQDFIKRTTSNSISLEMDKIWIHLNRATVEYEQKSREFVPESYLFRPNNAMLTIQEAVGSTVAWPFKKVIPRDVTSEVEKDT